MKLFKLFSSKKIKKYDDFFIKDTLIENYPNPIFHYSAFNLVNAGDNILVPALRKSISNVFENKPNFISQYVRNKLEDRDIYLINKSKGMIIGGGGLFLKDTNPNDISGWQMPISIEQIEEIETPISLMAIGYNRFRNQDDFEDYFKENINKLFKKAAFVGIRNNGSIEALKQYLTPDLKEKLTFHPCATTILSKLYDIKEKEKPSKIVAFNIAFDRELLRYGNKQEDILTSIAKVAKTLSKDYSIQYIAHSKQDRKFLKYFDNLNVSYEIVALNKPITENKIIEAYSKPDLVLGVRGHAQMIPFGCKTPILSIISHDKLAWFLQDIKHTEWGVDVLDENFEEQLLNKAINILNNLETTKQNIIEAQNELYDITVKNLEKLSKIYK